MSGSLAQQLSARAAIEWFEAHLLNYLHNMRNIFQSGNLINVRVELSPRWLLLFRKSHSRVSEVRLGIKKWIAQRFTWHFMMPEMTLFNAWGLQVQFLRPKKSMCFCSAPVPHFTIFFAVSGEWANHIKFFTNDNDFLEVNSDLIQKKVEMQCDIYECVLRSLSRLFAHRCCCFSLVEREWAFNFFFDFKRQIHLWLWNFAIRAISCPIKCQTNANKQNVKWQKVQHVSLTYCVHFLDYSNSKKTNEIFYISVIPTQEKLHKS